MGAQRRQRWPPAFRGGAERETARRGAARLAARRAPARGAAARGAAGPRRASSCRANRRCRLAARRGGAAGCASRPHYGRARRVPSAIGWWWGPGRRFTPHASHAGGVGLVRPTIQYTGESPRLNRGGPLPTHATLRAASSALEEFLIEAHQAPSAIEMWFRWGVQAPSTRPIEGTSR